MPVRLYEAMYIVRPEVGDSELEALMGRVAQTVNQIGGTIDLHEVWDRRDLAYEIDGCTRGTYVICYVKADAQNIHLLRRELELEEQVLRHVIVLANPDAIWRPRPETPEGEEGAEVEEVEEAVEETEGEYETEEAEEIAGEEGGEELEEPDEGDEDE